MVEYNTPNCLIEETRLYKTLKSYDDIHFHSRFASRHAGHYATAVLNVAR